jgi:hypothetical protein
VDERRAAGTGRDGASAGPALPGPLRAAVGVLAVQAVGILLLGAGYGVRGLVGRPEDRLATVLAGLLAVLVGAALVQVARGLSRCRGWALSPTVVTEVLVGVVAVGLLQGGVPLVGVPLLASAAVVLGGLAARGSRAVLGPG